MEELLLKCIEIRNKGWIKGLNNFFSGSGITFEKEIGKEIENFEIPDYNGIEIKTHCKYSRFRISLFCATPDSILFAIKRIHMKYAYPDKDYPMFRVFNVSINTKSYLPMSKKYYFKLFVNYEEKCVVMNVYNRKYELIDCEISWSFDMLKEKLERKLSKLLVVEYLHKFINGEKYYYYNAFNYYKLKSFETFLYLIEQGKIYINFKIGVYKNGKRFGKIYDRGTSFVIDVKDLDLLFNYIFSL